MLIAAFTGQPEPHFHRAVFEMYIAFELVHYMLFLGVFLKLMTPTATASAAMAPTFTYTAVRLFCGAKRLIVLDIIIRNAASISKYLAIRIYVFLKRF